MSNGSAPFHFQRDGFTLVCGDGPELLVYEPDGQPRWKKFFDDLVIDVGVTRNHILVLNPDGRLRYYRVADGEPYDEVDAERPATRLYTSEGVAAICTADALVLAKPGQGAPIPMNQPTAVAFGPPGRSIGVGTADGSFYVLDANSGGVLGSVALQVPVGGCTWSQMGFWVVGAGKRLLLVSADGTSIVQELGSQEAPIGPCSATGEGAIIAVMLQGTNNIGVFELQNKRRAGTIEFRRNVNGIAFGPKAQLGVGLDDGDACTVDCFTGRATRTEPHPGRGRNSWNLKSDLDFPSLRGAVTFARSGGSPIASFVHIEEEGTNWLLVGVGCCAVFCLMSCLCSGALGLLYTFM